MFPECSIRGAGNAARIEQKFSPEKSTRRRNYSREINFGSNARSEIFARIISPGADCAVRTKSRKENLISRVRENKWCARYVETYRQIYILNNRLRRTSKFLLPISKFDIFVDSRRQFEFALTIFRTRASNLVPRFTCLTTVL